MIFCCPIPSRLFILLLYSCTVAVCTLLFLTFFLLGWCLATSKKEQKGQCRMRRGKYCQFFPVNINYTVHSRWYSEITITHYIHLDLNIIPSIYSYTENIFGIAQILKNTLIFINLCKILPTHRTESPLTRHILKYNWNMISILLTARLMNATPRQHKIRHQSYPDHAYPCKYHILIYVKHNSNSFCILMCPISMIGMVSDIVFLFGVVLAYISRTETMRRWLKQKSQCISYLL